MKVKMLQSQVGHRGTPGPNGSKVYVEFVRQIGDVVEVPDAQGEKMIRNGSAQKAESTKGN